MSSYDDISYFGLMYPQSTKAIMMIHGRGGEGIDLVNSLEGVLPINDYYIAAPNAPGNSWYPYSFLAPQDQNEPMLGNSLRLLSQLLDDLLDTGFKPADVYLLGFSQGACLALEFAARNAQRFGGVFALSGGLIGDRLIRSNYKGSFSHTPIFLGCSDRDSHIPLERVNESSVLLQEMGADVNKKIYPGMGHHINHDEIRQISSMLK